MSDKQKPELPSNGQELSSMASNRDVAALFSNLQFKPIDYQQFTRRKASRIIEQPPALTNHGPNRRARVHIGLFSPMGGSGTSTLTASLGSILHYQASLRVLLVDTSPWQALAFHFGASEARPGKRTFFAPGSRDSKIHILSCDESASGLPDLDAFAATTPVDCVLLDLGGVSGPALDLCLCDCDAIIVPLMPDPSAVRLANAVKERLSKLEIYTPRVRFVLNQMDESPDANKVQTLLSQTLGEHLFPFAIRHQIEVHDAIADGVVLPLYAPKAQATTVCHEIGQWLQVSAAHLTKTELRWSEE